MSETIVFFGSGPVAAASLKLLADNFDIEAVITKPQPAHHKESFPVIEEAKRRQLTILTASNQRELSTIFQEHDLKSSLGVIIDHGIILKKDVIEKFPLGIINSHFSLLPRWRGPDPISYAILNGDEETGVSLMVIVEELDEGALIAQAAVPIASDATTPSLTEELINVSHQLLCQYLPRYQAGDIIPYPQSNNTPTYSRKLKKVDGIIDWNKSVIEIERQIRAYKGWPRSRTTISQIDCVITAAHTEDQHGEPGKLYIHNRSMGVFCLDGLLMIDSLTPAGKKEMSAQAFLNGYKP